VGPTAGPGVRLFPHLGARKTSQGSSVSRWTPRRSPRECGRVHAPLAPSPADSSLTDTPSPRAAHASKGVSVPGPRVQCPTRIRSDQRVVLWSIGTPSPRSLTRPSSDRAADCPDFARAACIRHHAAILSTPAASRGVSPVARRDVGNPVGSPDRALMCEPASHLAPPAPPPSILGPGSH